MFTLHSPWVNSFTPWLQWSSLYWTDKIQICISFPLSFRPISINCSLPCIQGTSVQHISKSVHCPSYSAFCIFHSVNSSHHPLSMQPWKRSHHSHLLSLTLHKQFIIKFFQLQLWHLSQINPLSHSLFITHTPRFPTISHWTIAFKQASTCTLWSAFPEPIIYTATRPFENGSQIMSLSGMKFINSP